MSGAAVILAQDMVTISEAKFERLINKRAAKLLGMARYLSLQPDVAHAMTRPFLGRLLAESSIIVELLDAYGARNNCKWFHFRFVAAGLKRFSDAGYELLHVLHSANSYLLLPVERDFDLATRNAIASVGRIIWTGCSRLLAQARSLGLEIPRQCPDQEDYAEELPPGRLPRNCAARKLQSVSQTMAHLSTAFLNLAAESEVLHTTAQAAPEKYESFVPDAICEKHLRDLQQRFHNLQSQYDTYVSETETEGTDPDLPVLRGHISVVFHLLKVATAFTHYYERHVRGKFGGCADCTEPLVEPDFLLELLMDYTLAFSSQYVKSARSLCQTMLKRYAEVGRIEVPVPQYRGFHVRPSTLVAKIVLHYGSEVFLEMDGKSFDASCPLDIFRVNEKINAAKRNWLAQELARLPQLQNNGNNGDVQEIARNIVLNLAAEGKVAVYQQPLDMPEAPVERSGTLLQWVIDEIARLQAMGKIDIIAKFSVTFVGDKRVLSDIHLLAEKGYGEDRFGNNVDLPDALSYLCHSRLSRSDIAA